ncbi:MAG: NAD-dependent succinate-semialdehyde dehydrogenase [Bacteroidetes bacterium]|nr:NAD-dependent succinate-semialdehyde dehydrogenase [Bacteroidota bacterium]
MKSLRMSKDPIIAVNPATEEEVGRYDSIGREELIRKMEQTDICFREWSQRPMDERCQLMKNLADVLESRKEDYAQIITSEMGKVFQAGISEIEKCAWVCRYYAENGPRFLEDEKIQTDASTSYVSFQPLGVILAVMPWNFPFWQVFRFAAPALVAGNTGLLKHASNVPGCAQAIENSFLEAGFPNNAFCNLPISSSRVKEVLENPLVRAATLTGSEKAGSSVALESGKRIKKTVLELGGSDAYLILADADLELAVNQCVKSRLLNAGQSCIGAKRFIVVEEVYHAFMALFLEKMRAAKMGDPTDSDSDFGPLARMDLRDELHKQVERSVDAGANLDLGGRIPPGKGAWYPATVLSNVKPGMPAFDEELFGPVAAVIRAKNEKEAIDLANKSDFGLGAAVFTKDLNKGEDIARNKLQAGSCFVNGLVKSDPRLPFGGIKVSGYGRELSHYGIKEFVNIKTVWIR